MTNTRRFPRTLARAQREQLGVQLRVEPDSLAYLTAVGERACGGCGHHCCSCPPVPLPRDDWRKHYDKVHLIDYAKDAIACGPLPGSPRITPHLVLTTCPRCIAAVYAPQPLDCGHPMTASTTRIYMDGDERTSCEACNDAKPDRPAELPPGWLNLAPYGYTCVGLSVIPQGSHGFKAVRERRDMCLLPTLLDALLWAYGFERLDNPPDALRGYGPVYCDGGSHVVKTSMGWRAARGLMFDPGGACDDWWQAAARALGKTAEELGMV